MADPQEYIQIEDFSPGIYTVFRDAAKTDGTPVEQKDIGNASVAIPGVASLLGTYGCTSDRTNSLVPLPKRELIDDQPGGAVLPPVSAGRGAPGDSYLIGVAASAPAKGWSGWSSDTVLDRLVTYLAWEIALPRPYTSGGQSYVGAGGHVHVVKTPYQRGMRVGDPSWDLMHQTVLFTGPLSYWGDPDDPYTSGESFLLPSAVFARMANYQKDSSDTKIGVATRAIAYGHVLIVSGPWLYPLPGPVSSDAKAAMYEVYDTAAANFIPPLANYSEPVGTGPCWIRVENMPAVGGSALLRRGGIYLDSVHGAHHPQLWPAVLSMSSVFGEENRTVPNAVRAATVHQGRLVMVDTGSPGFLIYSDWMAPAQDMSVKANTPHSAHLDDTYSTGYYNLFLDAGHFDTVSEIASVPGGQLLLITDESGGVIIGGDLDAPTVRSLPFVESAHGVRVKATPTPSGVAYGSTTGIFVWGGGESSTLLSSQLEGQFWDCAQSENEGHSGYSGSLLYWDEKLLTPNNFLYNFPGGGWWRLEQPYEGSAGLNRNMPYAWHEAPGGNMMIAFPYKTTVQDRRCAYAYFPNLLRHEYRWTSAPMAVESGRSVALQNIRTTVTSNQPYKLEVTARVWGARKDAAAPSEGRVAYDETSVTLVSPDPPSGPSGGRPVMLRADFPDHLSGEVLTISVKATACKPNGTANPDGVAPTIHNLNLGFGGRARVPRMG